MFTGHYLTEMVDPVIKGLEEAIITLYPFVLSINSIVQICLNQVQTDWPFSIAAK